MVIRIALDPRSLARLAEHISDVAEREMDVEAHRVARVAANLMEETIPQTFADHGLAGKTPRGGRPVDARGLVKFVDAFEATAEKTAKGWEADLHVRSDLSQEEYAKVFSVLSGSVPHDIEPKNARLLTGWYWKGELQASKLVKHRGTPARFDTLKLVRDRVYQRIRRGTV